MTNSNLNPNEDYISLLTNSGFFTKSDAEAFSSKFKEISIISETTVGYCVVLKAKRHGKWHAIKRLKPQYAQNPTYIQLLEKEFEIGYQLDHPHIAKVLDKEYDNNGMFVISEFVDGDTLSLRMQQQDFRNDLRLIRRIIRQLNEALGYIHSKQIIHRDLKPENILITHNGSNVKIIDFGLSDTDSHHVFKGAAGTRKYAAPEQLSGGSPMTFKGDYYSLGLIIMEILTGDTDPSKITLSKVPLNQIIAGCIHFDHDKRYGYTEVKANLVEAKYNKKSNQAYLALGLVTFCAIGAWLIFIPQDSDVLNNEVGSKITDDLVKQESPVLLGSDTSLLEEIQEKNASIQADYKEVSPKNEISTINSSTVVDLLPEDKLVIEAKNLVPSLFHDFLEKYQDVFITIENSFEPGVEWGKLKMSIPKSIAEFYTKLEPGSSIEDQCTRIIETDLEAYRLKVVSMFEYSLEQSGIPSERKARYMRKMLNIYNDSLMANMQTGQVNQEALARFRDSTRKYNRLRATKEMIQSIVVPDDFQ